MQAANSGSSTVPVVAFKPSHYTRGNDGAPSEVFPLLSADADKGDQDAVVLAGYTVTAGVPDPAYTVSGRCQGSGRDSQDTYVIVNVEHALHEGKAFRTRNVVPSIAMTVPIDLRQTARGEKDTNNRHESSGGSPGTGIANDGDPAFTVSERGQAVAHTLNGYNALNVPWYIDPVARALYRSTQCSWTTEDGTGRGSPLVAQEVAASRAGMAVRRLTPRECERLQGFPDDYTLIEYRGKPAADGKRYKALGNSMAVNVMRFIGERIALIESHADDSARSGDNLRELSEIEQERIRVAAGLPSKRRS